MIRNIVIDTNLLVLLVVGTTSRDYIRKHKRLAAYDDDAFILLQKLLSASSGIIVSPNTLSEASNLLAYIEDPARSEIYTVFSRMISHADERYVPSRTASTRREFVRLGLADSVLLEISANDVVLLTADLDLYLSAVRCGYAAINFDHEREALGLLP